MLHDRTSLFFDALKKGGMLESFADDLVTTRHYGVRATPEIDEQGNITLKKTGTTVVYLTLGNCDTLRAARFVQKIEVLQGDVRDWYVGCHSGIT